MVNLISVPMNCKFHVLHYFFASHLKLETLPTTHTVMFFQRLHILWCVFIFTSYLSIAFTETSFFRHLLTLLTQNVAEHSCGSKTLASHRIMCSEHLSFRRHRLKRRRLKISTCDQSSILVFEFPSYSIPEWIVAT